VRRSGKSELMKAYIRRIREMQPEANIIFVDFFDLKYEGLKEYHALYDYIESHYASGKQNYLFVDEVQLCEKFELAINSLHSSRKYDLYITGSNAFLLGSDLTTLFSVCSTKPLKKSRTALDTRGERLRCFEFDEMAGI